MRDGHVLALLFIVFTLGFIIGAAIISDKMHDLRREAVQLGYAKWEIDAMGDKTFVWVKR